MMAFTEDPGEQEIHEIFTSLSKKCISEYKGNPDSYTIKRWPDYVKASQMINCIESLPMTQVQGPHGCPQSFAMKFRAVFENGHEKVFSVGFCYCGGWLGFGHEDDPFTHPLIHLTNARIIRDIANGMIWKFVSKDQVKSLHMNNSMFNDITNSNTVSLMLAN
jgi:hypothetical protein